uniref:Uncharacterized protein n=1 Tax=Rhizophora mucronata TaxID=61149 RepID=A0A2P2Q8P9_RHIMU
MLRQCCDSLFQCQKRLWVSLPLC